MKNYLLIIFFAFLTAAGLLHGQENPSFVRRALDYHVRDSVDNYGNLYIRYHSFLPSVLTFVNSDGSVTVCASDDGAKVTYVYEYSADLEEQKTLDFQNEIGTLGAFTKDDDGNYYFFYAFTTSNKSAENMALVKYNRSREKLNTYKLIANAPNSFGGIQVPFDAGTCRLELSGSMLAVYFARKKFDGHQASYAIILDKDTFERIDRGIVDNRGYTQRGNNTILNVSHSFNQFILSVENGFIFADHGDAYPRCFTFSRFQKENITKQLNAFAFPGNKGVNATYAELGGLVKTSDGFLFAGTYGRVRENPRNLFILTFDEGMTACSNPVYLTGYARNDGHAGHPKIVSLNDGRFLLLWERFSYSTQSANSIVNDLTGYLSTYMIIINDQGEAIGSPRELKGIRLNMNDTLRYNPRNRKAYWAINDSSSSITIFALDITSY